MGGGSASAASLAKNGRGFAVRASRVKYILWIEVVGGGGSRGGGGGEES